MKQNQIKSLTRAEMKKVTGGLANNDYICQCDGQVEILWSAEASIKWINANCSGQFECNQLPSAV